MGSFLSILAMILGLFSVSDSSQSDSVDLQAALLGLGAVSFSVGAVELIDNNHNNPSATPEIPSVIVLSLGLGGLIATRRKTKN